MKAYFIKAWGKGECVCLCVHFVCVKLLSLLSRIQYWISTIMLYTPLHCIFALYA